MMLQAIDPFDPRICLPDPDDDEGVRVWLDKGCTVFGLVSACDARWVFRHMWSLHIDQRGKDYCRRSTGPDSTGKRGLYYLHREVLQRAGIKPPSPDHNLVDHINGRGTDNRRSNLRWVTPSENARNLHGIDYRQPVLWRGERL
jgi:HNH endonuclease